MQLTKWVHEPIWISKSLRFTFANFFSLETAKPIESQPPWNGKTKKCSNGPSDMTNNAIIPIYGKNLKKIFFSGTKKMMTLKVGM